MPDREQERELTPRQIVAELDRDIVGQADAKRARGESPSGIAGGAGSSRTTCDSR